MNLFRYLFGMALLALTSVALVLGLALLCVWEARQIVRLTRELLLARVPACRATCDR